jgi:hypothetical protein
MILRLLKMVRSSGLYASLTTEIRDNFRDVVSMLEDGRLRVVQGGTTINREPATGPEEIEEVKSVEQDRPGEGGALVNDLLSKGDGLSHTSWMKVNGYDPKKDRAKTKGLYERVLKEYEGKIYQKAGRWYMKDVCN